MIGGNKTSIVPTLWCDPVVIVVIVVVVFRSDFGNTVVFEQFKRGIKRFPYHGRRLSEKTQCIVFETTTLFTGVHTAFVTVFVDINVRKFTITCYRHLDTSIVTSELQRIRK